MVEDKAMGKDSRVIKNDGGAAFPGAGYSSGGYIGVGGGGGIGGIGGSGVFTQTGMTLRDYFAAKAMQAIITNEALWSRGDMEASVQKKTKAQIASEYAYTIADEMLEARK